MNCRRAQSDIALWAGNDLDETDRQGLQRHLEACPECKKYHEQMQALMRLVEDCPLRDEADEASKAAVRESLWPSLSVRLASVPSPQSDRFNGWVPAVAVAAVCLAMVLVASPQHAFSPQEAPHASAESESEWNRDTQPVEFLEDTAPVASPPRRVREPIQILPVGEQEPLSPRFDGPNEDEMQMRWRELEDIRSFLMDQQGVRRFPEERLPPFPWGWPRE